MSEEIKTDPSLEPVSPIDEKALRAEKLKLRAAEVAALKAAMDDDLKTLTDDETLDVPDTLAKLPSVKLAAPDYREIKAAIEAMEAQAGGFVTFVRNQGTGLRAALERGESVTVPTIGEAFAEWGGK